VQENASASVWLLVQDPPVLVKKAPVIKKNGLPSVITVLVASALIVNVLLDELPSATVPKS
jgi:hypothetical protein